MKRTIKGYILGFVSAAILLSGIAYATETTTLYDVLANGISIFIDGEKLNPKDANGNPVEPLIYNGTTYLPVRAIATAFGKEVSWDGETKSVYIKNGLKDGEDVTKKKYTLNFGWEYEDIQDAFEISGSPSYAIYDKHKNIETIYVDEPCIIEAMKNARLEFHTCKMDMSAQDFFERYYSDQGLSGVTSTFLISAEFSDKSRYPRKVFLDAGVYYCMAEWAGNGVSFKLVVG